MKHLGQTKERNTAFTMVFGIVMTDSEDVEDDLAEEAVAAAGSA